MIRKALVYSFTSKYITLIIQIASTLILARILTPEHIGLFTIASALTGIAQMFRDFGISEYLIKEKVINRRVLSSAFTASIIIAWPIATLLIIASPLLSLFYEHKDVGYLITILSLNMFLSPFGSIPMSVMRKNLNFKPISIANVSNTLVNTSASVALAFLGFEAYSLAIASVLGTVTTVTIITLHKNEKTQFGIEFSGVKKVLSFGKNVGGSNIIAYIANNMLELVISKNNDLATLGLYSRGKSTITLFKSAAIDAIQPLISPYYASARNHPEKAEGYILSTKIVLYLSLPFCITTGMLSETIIQVLYGAQWMDASVYLRYIAISFVIYTMSMFYEQILTTENQSKLYLKFKISIATANIMIALSSFLLSLEEVLILLIFLSIFRLLWVVKSLSNIIGLSYKAYISMLSKPLFISGIYTLVALPLLYLNIENSLLKLTLLIFPCLVWLFMLYIVDRKIINKIFNLNL
ncbi:oligosaccharide flippase family protein [Colwellia sp. MEBiC06753]